MYRSGGLILLISALGGIAGLLIMTTKKRWKAVIGIILGYILYAFIGYGILSLPSAHERILFGIPFLIPFPFLLMSGILVWDAATNEKAFNQRWERYINRKTDPVKRKKGNWQLLLGFIVWLYWGFHPNLSGKEMAIVIALWGYPTIFGLQNFFSKQEETSLDNK